MVLNTNIKIFVIYVAIQKQKEISMHLEKKTQIKAQGKDQNRDHVEALLFNQSSTKVLAIYFNYSNVF